LSLESNKAAIRHAWSGSAPATWTASSRCWRRLRAPLPGHAATHAGTPRARRDGAWLQANKTTFPDYREDVEMLVGEGDFVAWRSKGTGTQLGPMGPFPATGRRMSITIIGMHRFENGKIAETWTSWDNVAALAQLGLMP